MRKHTLNLALVTAALALAGCKSNDTAPLTPFCTAFTTPAVTETCPVSCTIHSGTGGKEIDGDLHTAVEIDATGGSNTDTAKLKVVGGATVASGTLAGAFVTEPNEATHSTRTIRTYAGATLQETATGNQLTLHRSGGGTDAVAYVGFKTTKSFDTLEYEVTLDYPSGVTTANKVYELCADGDVDGG